MVSLGKDICIVINRYLKTQPFNMPLSPRDAAIKLRVELPAYEISDDELEDAVTALAVSRGHVLFFDLAKLTESPHGSASAKK